MAKSRVFKMANALSGKLLEMQLNNIARQVGKIRAYMLECEADEVPVEYRKIKGRLSTIEAEVAEIREL